MEPAEELDLSGASTRRVSYEVKGTAPSVVLVEEALEAPKAHRWATLSLALNLVAVVGLLAGAYVLGTRMLALDRGATARTQITESLAARVDSLAAQSQALTAEVQGLKSNVVARTTEDVIFLKTIILKPSIDVELARTIARSTQRYADLHGRDPNLILAIMAVESSFEPAAVSPVGATGLMQVMPHWKKVLAITGDLKDPDTSIRYGVQILGFYEEMYKDLGMALTAYNRGPGPVDRALMRGEDPGNTYAPKVLEVYERLKKLNVQAGK